MSIFKATVAKKDGVATIFLDREDRLNAWRSTDRTELARILTGLEHDDGVDAIVVTGAGSRAFCAGQDFEETKEFMGGPEGHKWLRDVKAFYDVIRSLEKPTVAALNGVAAGSGFQVALLLDFRIAHAGVMLGQPEVNSGIPSVVGPWIIQQYLSPGRTRDLALSGRLLSAQQAWELGVVNELVPAEEVLSRSHELARQLADQPPNAFRWTKRGFREATQASFDAAFEFADLAQTAAFASGEPQRMMEKFFAQRAARKLA